MGAVTLGLLIFISLPEAALNLWVFHLLMHGKHNLVPDKEKLMEKLNFKKNKPLSEEDELKLEEEIHKTKIVNVVKFCITVALMLVVTEIVRPISPDPAINNLCHDLAYIIIIGLIYRYNPWDLTLNVVLWSSLFVVFENLYTPFIFTHLRMNVTELVQNIPLVFLVSFPDRLLQAAGIIFLNKYQYMITYTKLKKIYYPLLVILVALNYIIDSLTSRFIKYIPVINMKDNIIIYLCLVALMVMYIPVFMVAIKTSIRTTQDANAKYMAAVDETTEILLRLDKLLAKGDTVSARKFIKALTEDEIDKDKNENKDKGSGAV